MQNKLIPLALAAIAIKIGYYLTCSFINQNNLSLVSSLIFYVPFIGLHIAIFFAIIKHNEFGRYAFLVTVILGYMLFFDGEPIPNTQIKNEIFLQSFNVFVLIVLFSKAGNIWFKSLTHHSSRTG